SAPAGRSSNSRASPAAPPSAATSNTGGAARRLAGSSRTKPSRRSSTSLPPPVSVTPTRIRRSGAGAAFHSERSGGPVNVSPSAETWCARIAASDDSSETIQTAATAALPSALPAFPWRSYTKRGAPPSLFARIFRRWDAAIIPGDASNRTSVAVRLPVRWTGGPGRGRRPVEARPLGRLVRADPLQGLALRGQEPGPP